MSDEVSAALQSLGLKPAGRCAHSVCKTSTVLLGQTCSYCKERFCLAHGQPEVHGCAADASKSAKAAWRAEHSSSRPPPKPSAKKTAELKQKLTHTLGEKTEKRKPGSASKP